MLSLTGNTNKKYLVKNDPDGFKNGVYKFENSNYVFETENCYVFLNNTSQVSNSTYNLLGVPNNCRGEVGDVGDILFESDNNIIIGSYNYNNVNIGKLDNIYFDIYIKKFDDGNNLYEIYEL
jgi:hypothetical protein